MEDSFVEPLGTLRTCTGLNLLDKGDFCQHHHCTGRTRILYYHIILLYRKDKDSGEDGGWFDGPGDSGWDPTDVKARESIIKFAGVDTEEEEMEREPREMVRQKMMMMMMMSV